MSQNKFEIRNLRLVGLDINRQAFNFPIVVDLYKVIVSDFGCFRILNEFFNVIHTNLDVKKRDIESRLNLWKEEQEINGITISDSKFTDLCNILINLFDNDSISVDLYKDIYTKYLEYLTMQWKRIPGKFGKVVFEPLLKYKRKELFEGKDFSKSRCDVVSKNSKEKKISVYECKFGMKTFLQDLKKTPSQYSGNSKTQKRKRNQSRLAHNKIGYLKECQIVFSENSNNDIKECDVKIITFATRNSLQSVGSSLSGIALYTREDIESQTFYNSLK